MRKLWPVEDSEGFGQHRTGQVDPGVDLGPGRPGGRPGSRPPPWGSTIVSTSPLQVDLVGLFRSRTRF